MARHVERRHAEWICMQLERFLAAKERFAGKRVDLRDLLVSHGVAAGRRGRGRVRPGACRSWRRIRAEGGPPPLLERQPHHGGLQPEDEGARRG